MTVASGAGDVLVVQHEPQCPPGRVGRWLTAAGARLDVRRPYDGEPLPADLSGHAGLVVLGGHMGANDDELVPWLPATKALLRDAASRSVPALGICLGHQLAAVALGGRVERNPRGKRRGVLDMGWASEAAADPVLSGCGPVGVQWHQDVVTAVPDETRELAHAATGELLAARFAPTVWAVQSHPEAGPDIVARWAESDVAAATSDAERAAIRQQLDDVHRASDALEEGWAPMGAAFARLVTAADVPPLGRQVSN